MTVHKKKVEVNAGATIIVTVNGEEKRFSCSGSNEGGRNLTPEQVIRNLSNCIKDAAKGKGHKIRRR